MGSDGNDNIDGGSGDDTIRGWDGNDILNGGAGNDTLHGEDGDDSIYGFIGNDTIRGGDGDDNLYGGSGYDMFVFGGRDGNDTIGDFMKNEDLIRVGDGKASADKIQEILDSVVQQGGFYIYTIFNNTSVRTTVRLEASSFYGENSILRGDDTDDTNGGGDTDGNGTDGNGTDGGGGMTDYTGTSGNDLHIGTDGPERIEGGGGIDLLRGGGGNDTLDGGAGPDSLYGDRNNDNIVGGPGDDLIRGGKGNDTLSGGAGSDVIQGDLGDDYIYATGDGDIIDGGPGMDTVDYGRIDDLTQFPWGADPPKGHVQASFLFFDLPQVSVFTPEWFLASVFWTAGTGRDLIRNVEVVRGGAINDYIDLGAEGAGAMEIHGGAGHDVVIGRGAAVVNGGAGDDTVGIRAADGAVLTGGPGADTFGFSELTESATITDFTDADVIRFATSTFGTIPAGGIQAMLDGSSGNELDLSLLGVEGMDHGTITLTGVQVSDLTVDDFLIT